MKALSIRPDYAFQILTGEKTSEFRSWATKHRGPLLICSTAQRIPATIPGHALYVANVVDVKQLGPKSYEWVFGDGGYYIKPFKVKGKQRLFEVDDKLITCDPINELDGVDSPEAEKALDAWVANTLEPLYV